MLYYFFIIIISLILTSVFGILSLMLAILFLSIGTLSLIVSREQYVRKYKNNEKSLSFAMLSMKQKKKEFRIINKFSFLSSNQKILLKKLSVLVDKLFMKNKKISFENDYFGDPAYSLSVTNMFHTRKN